jgi:hypothetical protein
MEPARGGFAANMRHGTLRALEKIVCLTLELQQLEEINPTHGPDS